MARIRSIKPEFFTSEQTVGCSRDARLLFIGLWTFADDGGVHTASIRSLKMQVFPDDAVSTEQVQGWVDELLRAGLLHAYTVDGKAYWLVTGWFDHQRIDRPTYRYPMPNGKVPTTRSEGEQWSRTRRGLVEDSTNDRRHIVEASTNPPPAPHKQHVDKQRFDEDSSSARRAVVEASATESKGEERREEEEKNSSSPSPALRADPLARMMATHPRAREVCQQFWNKWPHMERQNARAVHEWLLDGAVPEEDIYPAIERIWSVKGRSVGSYEFFDREVRSCITTRKERDEQHKRLEEFYAGGVSEGKAGRDRPDDAALRPHA